MDRKLFQVLCTGQIVESSEWRMTSAGLYVENLTWCRIQQRNSVPAAAESLSQEKYRANDTLTRLKKGPSDKTCKTKNKSTTWSVCEIRSVYEDTGQGKAARPHRWEAATSERLKTVPAAGALVRSYLTWLQFSTCSVLLLVAEVRQRLSSVRPIKSS